MDAVKFLNEYYRMCNTYHHPDSKDVCEDCPLFINSVPCSLDDCKGKRVNEIISVVEQWSKENPAKTYKDDFLEKFPKTNFPKEYLFKKIRWCELYNYGDCDKGNNTNCANCGDCWEMEMEL